MTGLLKGSRYAFRIGPIARAWLVVCHDHAEAKLDGQRSASSCEPGELGRARLAILGAGAQPTELSEHEEATAGRIAVGTMHLAKGLEFKAVAVMACDDNVLPLPARLEAVADEVEIDEVYETERHLLYVACTRARDRLYVSGVSPASEFFGDMQN